MAAGRIGGCGAAERRPLPEVLAKIDAGEIVGREDRSDTATGGTGDGSTPAFILLSEVQVPAARTEENYQSW